MKKIIAAAAALTASFGMIGSSGAFAESYNYDLDDIEGLYYANDDYLFALKCCSCRTDSNDTVTE